jgi:hypothetical protein
LTPMVKRLKDFLLLWVTSVLYSNSVLINPITKGR